MDSLRAVPHKLARETVARILREAIIDTKIAPGILLTESRVAEALGVSRVPVREALRSLESERLVKVIHGRGVQVARLDMQQIHEEYELRLVLEPWAAVAACDRATTDELDRLEELTKKARVSIDEGDFHVAAKFNADFHTSLVQLAGNGIVSEIVKNLWGALRLTLLLTNSDAANRVIDEKLEEQHKELLHAMRKRDHDAVHGIASRHIRGAFQHQRRLYEYAQTLVEQDEDNGLELDDDYVSGVLGQ